MPLSFADRIVAKPDVMFRAAGDEAVLLNLRTELYLGLNPIGTRMWAALTESASIENAYDSILSQFDVGADELRHDLEEFVGKLLEHQLIEVKSNEVSSGNQSP